MYLSFQDVPVNKLPEVREKLQKILKLIYEKKDIDMERLHSIINKYKLESLSNIENSPHNSIAFMIIGHMLYGNKKQDVSLYLQLIDIRGVLIQDF